MLPTGPLELHVVLLVAAAGFYAGTQNVLAGGGSFITFPALLLAGLNPLAANITSTIAMFPGQITSAIAGRHLVGDVGRISFSRMFAISLVGGVAGALLLLSTPAEFFARLVPWLVLFATSVFAWGSFRNKPLHATPHLPVWAQAAIQGCIAIYGGYFGGGIGFLMLAALTVAGQEIRMANATKNVLAMAMNASAVAIFAFSAQVNWPAALALGVGGVAGGICGSWLMHRLPARVMRGFIVLVGVALTIWLFMR